MILVDRSGQFKRLTGVSLLSQSGVPRRKRLRPAAWSDVARPAQRPVLTKVRLVSRRRFLFRSEPCVSTACPTPRASLRLLRSSRTSPLLDLLQRPARGRTARPAALRPAALRPARSSPSARSGSSSGSPSGPVQSSEGSGGPGRAPQRQVLAETDAPRWV